MKKTISFNDINDTQEVFKIICEEILGKSFSDVKREFLPESDPTVPKIKFSELMIVVAKAKIPFGVTLIYDGIETAADRSKAKEELILKNPNETLRVSDVHEKMTEQREDIDDNDDIPKYQGKVFKEPVEKVVDPKSFPAPPTFT
jgi:hypothetical protein